MLCLFVRSIRLPRPQARAVLRATNKLLDRLSCLAGAVRRVLQPGLCRGGQPGRLGSGALLQTIFHGPGPFVPARAA